MKCQIQDCHNERLGDVIEYDVERHIPFCRECLDKIYAQMQLRIGMKDVMKGKETGLTKNPD